MILQKEMIIQELDWVNGVAYGGSVVLDTSPPHLQFLLMNPLQRLEK